MAEIDDRLAEIREFFRLDNQAWDKIREEGDTDMRYVAGDPWEPRDRRQRESALRVCLSHDEINQYCNQIINDVRQNPRSIKFTPQGNGANDDTAEFYANKTREIEYRSHAQLAYITMFENCVQRSFGWLRIVSKYAQDTVTTADLSATYQDLWIEPIPNPNMVVPDRHAKRPDHSDMRRLFFLEQFGKTEFKERFPKATITDFTHELITRLDAGDWFRDGSVQVAEYWERKRTGTKRLLVLKPFKGQTSPYAVWQDDLQSTPSSDHIVTHRDVDQFKVTQTLTNGVEVLSATAWKGQYIPFVSCVGKVMYVDAGTGSERKIMSLPRLMRSPQMLYAYYCTTEAEIVGAIPKFPYFYYEGQISPENLELLAKSPHEPVIGIAVKATVPGLGEGGQPLPPPVRQPWDPPLQGIQLGKESARRAIQAAAGVTPLPTAAQRRNEKSGVALEQIEKTEQVGSYHYSQHYDDAVRHAGVILEDLIDKVYDTARDTPTRTANDDIQLRRINDPSFQPNQQYPEQQKPLFTKGTHAVTVSSGPAADSQREAVSEFVATLSQIPEVMQLCGDLIVRLQSKTMNLGPLLEELADRLTPQQFRKPDQQPDPQQLQQQNAQMQQQLQAAQDAIAKLTMEIKTKQAEYQQQGQIEAMKKDKDFQRELELKKMDIAAKIEIARIGAAKQPADLGRESAEEAIALGLEHAQDANQAAADRQHEVQMAQLEHQHALEQAAQGHQQSLVEADQAHQQALAQGAQGVQGQLAVGQQTAALTPPEQPEGGA